MSYHIVRDDDGQWLIAHGNEFPAARDLPAPPGARFYRTDERKLYTYVSGEWVDLLAASVTTEAVTADAATIDAATITDAEIDDSLVFGGAALDNFTIYKDSENLTLDTGGATTDTAGNLLHANSLILATTVTTLVTITTAASFKTGDASDDDRLIVSTAKPAVGSSLKGAAQFAAGTPFQAAAASVRITCNATPGAGRVRVTVYGITFATV